MASRKFSEKCTYIRQVARIKVYTHYGNELYEYLRNFKWQYRNKIYPGIHRLILGFESLINQIDYSARQS